ncbi:hypothetical protein [Nocardia veterana]|uniref:hypothetical protein n=1 Tax=Nocardia veterana TaxID=132249 RepID=UPI0002EA4FEA
MNDEPASHGSEAGGAATEPARRLFRYLERTLIALPIDVRLALSHPRIPGARFHGGVLLPCVDGRADTVFFDIAYWIIGVPADRLDWTFDLIVRGWSEAGWPVDVGRLSRPRAAFARTSDGFGLAVRQSVDGDLSLAGSTPPFFPGTGVEFAFPETIVHPGAGMDEPYSVSSADAPAEAPTPWTRPESP